MVQWYAGMGIVVVREARRREAAGGRGGVQTSARTVRA